MIAINVHGMALADKVAAILPNHTMSFPWNEGRGVYKFHIPEGNLPAITAKVKAIAPNAFIKEF